MDLDDAGRQQGQQQGREARDAPGPSARSRTDQDRWVAACWCVALAGTYAIHLCLPPTV